MLSLNLAFRHLIEKYIWDKPVVTLTKEEIQRASDFAQAVVESKQKEEQYKIDGRSIQKRFFTGISSEIAVEKYLGIKFVDYSIGGSKKYNYPDMKSAGIQGGVKSTEVFKFPLVPKINKYPQAMVVKQDDFHYYICGIAQPNVLDRYQSDLFVLDKNILKKWNKSAFYGFAFLETL